MRATVKEWGVSFTGIPSKKNNEGGDLVYYFEPELVELAMKGKKTMRVTVSEKYGCSIVLGNKAFEKKKEE